MTVDVDLVVISRNAGQLPVAVQKGIAQQRGVSLHVHRVVGEPRPDDSHRWETIARARNHGKALGESRWFMFLDDDVVLAPNTVSQLVNELERHPRLGALAANYLGDSTATALQGHVAMGSTLFRRASLSKITFRWMPQRCECQCCCDDLRQQGYGIAYSKCAIARHRGNDQRQHMSTISPVVAHHLGATDQRLDGHILAAFDRNHFEYFRHQFLVSLCANSNSERLIVAGYDLLPSQVRTLRRFPNVDVHNFGNNRSTSPAIRRLKDFQLLIAGLEEARPIAYWDAGDVIFQSPLTELWNLVRAYPGKLLAAREPLAHPDNPAVSPWTLSIRHDKSRQYAFELLSKRPVINGGFAAGTVATLRKYLSAAHDLRHSRQMKGTEDWGDQTALNLYCHSDPDVWHEIEDVWNFCLCGRNRRDYWAESNGTIVDYQQTEIRVVHGNARRLTTLSGYRNVVRMLNKTRIQQRPEWRTTVGEQATKRGAQQEKTPRG